MSSEYTHFNRLMKATASQLCTWLRLDSLILIPLISPLCNHYSLPLSLSQFLFVFPSLDAFSSSYVSKSLTSHTFTFLSLAFRIFSRRKLTGCRRSACRASGVWDNLFSLWVCPPLKLYLGISPPSQPPL